MTQCKSLPLCRHGAFPPGVRNGTARSRRQYQSGKKPPGAQPPFSVLIQMAVVESKKTNRAMLCRHSTPACEIRLSSRFSTFPRPPASEYTTEHHFPPRLSIHHQLTPRPSPSGAYADSAEIRATTCPSASVLASKW